MPTYALGYYWCWNGTKWVPAMNDEDDYWVVCGNDIPFKASDLVTWRVGPRICPPPRPHKRR